MKAFLSLFLAIICPIIAFGETNQTSSPEVLSFLSFLEDQGLVFQQTDLDHFDIVVSYDEDDDGYDVQMKHDRIQNISVDFYFDKAFQNTDDEIWIKPRLEILSWYFVANRVNIAYDDAVRIAGEKYEQISKEHDVFIRKEKMLARKSWNSVPPEKLKWAIEFYGSDLYGENSRPRWFVSLYYKYEIDMESTIEALTPLFPEGIPDWMIEMYKNQTIEWLSLEIDAQTGEVVYCYYDHCFDIED